MLMLSSIIDAELRGLRSKILEGMELYKRIEISNKPRWIEIRNIRRSTAVASDSSFTGILTRYAYIYGIRAFSSLFTGVAEDTIRFSKYLAKFDLIGPLVLYADNKVKEISPGIGRKAVTHIAKDLEVKAAKHVIESIKEPPDLILFDGSLRSFLYSRFRGSTAFSEDMRRGLEERVETLKNLQRSSKLVFISKTHSRHVLYKYLEPKLDGKPIVIPDYALIGKILESSGGRPGFIEPIKISNEVEGITYTLTYAILSRGAPAYQITIPGDLGVDQVAEILEMLRYHSIPGYPEPLRQCHLHSKIQRGEFIKLLNAYGALLETGREVLGEV
jgi:hypothetical protein